MNFFLRVASAFGIAVGVILFCIVTVALVYLSYVLAIGALITLIGFTAYHVIKASGKRA